MKQILNGIIIVGVIFMISFAMSGHAATINGILDTVFAKNIGGVIYADQYATLQDAIDNASGREIYIPSGIYNLSSSLSLNGKSNIKLRGAGMNQTILRAGQQLTLVSGNAGVINIVADGVVIQNIEISDLKLDGNFKTSTGSVWLFSLNGGSIENVKFSNVAFVNGTTDVGGNAVFEASNSGTIKSIELNSVDVTTYNSSSSGVQFGLQFVTTSGNSNIDTIKIIGSNMHDTGSGSVAYPAIAFNSQDAGSEIRNIIISGNTFNNTNGFIAQSYSNSAFSIHDVVISHNIMKNLNQYLSLNMGGIAIYGSKNVVIDSNIMINGTNSPALAPGRIGTPNENWIVTNNYIEGFNAVMDFDSANNFLFEGNILNRNGLIFAAYNEHKNNNIRGNIFKNTDVYTFYGNYNFSNSSIALESATDPMVIENNVFIDDQVTPTQKFAFGTPTNMVIKNHTVRNNILKGGTTGLLAPDGSGITWDSTNVFENNRYENNTGLRANRLNVTDHSFGYGISGIAPLIAGTDDYYINSSTHNVNVNDGTRWCSGTSSIGIELDNGTSVISSGIQGDVRLPGSGTIIEATTMSRGSGNLTMQFWIDSWANFPPTVADLGGRTLTMTGASSTTDTTLSGWTTTVTKGDVIRFNVSDVSTVNNATVQLTICKN